MERVLLLSDIHANLPALETVLESEKYDNIMVLGDLVDYGPYPGEVIDKLRQAGAHILRGNHDHAVGYGVDCRCGEKTHWLSVWTRENISNKLLSKKDKKFLAELPVYKLIGDSLYVHGSPESPLYDYVYPWIGYNELIMKLKRGRLGGKFLISGVKTNGLYKELYIGHTHYQFVLSLGGSKIVNPGSVGQPRDGDPRAAYAVITENGVFLKRKKYPVEKTINRLEQLGVPDPYYSALKYILLKADIPRR